MGLFVTEARAVLLASLAIVASEAVGVSETTQRGFDPLPLAHVEQIAASGTPQSEVSITEYYVDATSGNDANNGGVGSAWKTIAKVNGSTFKAGDSIYFKKDETWNETLTVPSSGSAGSPITFGAYGSGDKPVISGDVDSSGTHSVGDNDYGIDTNGKAYITATGIKLSLQNKSGIRIRNSQNIIFDDVDVYDSYEQGTCDDGTGGAPYQNEDITIKNGEFSYCGGAGINFSSADLIGTIYIQNNLVHHNCRLDVGGVGAHDSAAGIKFYGAGGATVYVENNEIYNNGIAGHTGNSGPGIWFDTLSISEGIARYNKIYDNAGSGILIEACSGQSAYYNVIYDNGSVAQANGDPRGWYSGIGIYGGNNNLIYNNTCYGNYWGISSENGVLNGTGNLVKNNAVDNSTAFEFFYAHASGLGNIDITETYNCFGAEKSGLTQINWVNKSTYADLATALGYTTYNVTADPLFVNAAGADFTLRPFSPCRDTGVDVGLTVDYTGAAVPVGAGYDIGAYEAYNLGIASTAQIGILESRETKLNMLIVTGAEQIVALENRRVGLDVLMRTMAEAVGIRGDFRVGLTPLFISATDGLKVWEWRVFPLGEHELTGVPIRVFMKGRT